MLSAISLNWQGRPVTNLETVVNLIGHPRTKKGLTIPADQDLESNPIRQKSSEEALQTLLIERPTDQPQWN